MSVLNIRNKDGAFVPIPVIKGDKPIRGVDYWTEADKSEIIDYLKEYVQSSGLYQIGSGLKLDVDTNTLSVDVAKEVEEGNTNPITAAAVFSVVGDIEELLSKI